MKKTIFFTICFLLICLDLPAQQKVLNVPSYYISPVNNYFRILLLPRAALEDLRATCTPHGLAHHDNTLQALRFCQIIPGSDTLESTLLPGLWTQSQGMVTLSNQNDLINQRIGIGTQTPMMKLTVRSSSAPADSNIGGLLALGQENNPLNTSGNFSLYTDIPAGTFPLFLWYPQKGAFRAQFMDPDPNIIPTADDPLWRENNVGYYSSALGHSNIAAGRASFTAGRNNQAWNHLTTIAGGENNLIQIPNANQANNQRFGSTIVGGFNNTISGPRNLIGGGEENTIAEANSCAIGGGFLNRIDNDLTTPATLLNADFNDETHSIILGGNTNRNFGRRCAISGGHLNVMAVGATYSSIIGGTRNAISSNADYSVIAGSQNPSTLNEENILAGPFSTVLTHGARGIITGSHNFVLLSSTVSTQIKRNFSVFLQSSIRDSNGSYMTVLTAHADTLLDADFSFVGNGYANYLRTTAQYSAVINGNQRLAGHHSFSTSVGTTGFSGDFTGNYSVTHGDRSTGDYSWTFKTYNGSYRNLAPRSFLFGGLSANFSTADRFILYANDGGETMKVGIGVDAPSKTLEVNGTIQATAFQLTGLNPGTDPLPDVYRHPNKTLFYYNDLAELFLTSEAVAPGDIVTIDSQNPGKLKKSSRPSDGSVIGVVSYMPAVVLKGDHILMAPEDPVQETTSPPVALAGRVNIKVCLENGPIRRGDLLTTSSIPGTAMKSSADPQSSHTIIAKALEDFNHQTTDRGEIAAIIMIR